MGMRRLVVTGELVDQVFKHGLRACEPVEPMDLRVVEARVIHPFGRRDIELLVECDQFTGGNDFDDAEPISLSFRTINPPPIEAK